MAQFDTSFYGQAQPVQIQNPLALMAQGAQLQAYQRQADKFTRDDERQNSLMQLVGTPEFQKMDAAGKAGALQGQGQFDAAGKVIESDARANRDTREAKKFELESSIKSREVLGGVLMQASKNPASAPALIQQLVDDKIIAPDYGQKVLAGAQSAPDPAAFFLQGSQASMTALQQMEQQYKAFDLEEKKRAHLAGETNASRNAATSEGNLAVSQQGLGLREQELQQRREDAAAGKVPAGYQRSAGGGLEPIKGGPADPDAKGFKLTEDQGKATGWLVQAEQAFKNLEAVGFKDGKPTSAARPGFADAVAGVYGGEAIGNWMRGADRQKFLQAAESASEALLRAATGAGVNKDEARQKARELIPQWGEDDETIKQKRAAYPLYLESLRIRAGPGAAQAGQVASSARSGGATGSWDAGGGAAPSKATGGTAAPQSKADYDALPSGTLFKAPDGSTRRKP